MGLKCKCDTTFKALGHLVGKRDWQWQDREQKNTVARPEHRNQKLVAVER